MKKILFVAIILSIFSCKNDAKKDTVLTPPTTPDELKAPVAKKDTHKYEIGQDVFVNAYSGLNYRAQPGGRVLGKLKNNTQINVTEQTGQFETIDNEKGEWIGVTHEGKTVYIFDNYVGAKVARFVDFEYNDTAGCKYSGKFNANKYTRTQLKNSINLLNGIENLQHHFKDFDKSKSLEQWEKEMRAEKAKVFEAKVVELTCINTVKDEHYKFQDKLYTVRKAVHDFYQNPESLSKFEAESLQADKFKEALLKGGDDLLAAWATLYAGSEGTDLGIRYQLKLNAPNKLQFAKEEVITKGFIPAVLADIFKNENASFDGKACQESFQKVFSGLKKDCN